MIVTLTGPSGIGKGYVASGLKRHFPSLRELVWLTTRPLRPGEEGKTNRRSISREEFLLLVEGGNLALVQDLYGNLYGLELTGASYERELWICELHVGNLHRAREIGLPIFSVALVPSDIAFLGTRLRSYRGSETEAEVAKRLSMAEREVVEIARNRAFFDVFLEVSAENEHRIVADVAKAVRILQGSEGAK